MTSSYISLRPPADMELFKGIKNPHITLAFFPDHPAEEIKTVLPDLLVWEPINLRIHGSGVWAGRPEEGGDPFWISHYTVECNDRAGELRALRRWMLSNLMNAGILYNDAYDFIPHITRFISSNPIDHLNAADILLDPQEFTADTLYIQNVGQHDQAYAISMGGPTA